MESREDFLQSLIKPVCENAGFIFLDVNVHGRRESPGIRVTVDTEQGITLDECQKLSRAIMDMFFIKDIDLGNYRLEVTSPGALKPLEFPFEFRRNIGRNLKVTYRDGEKIKEDIGELVSYEENGLTLRVKSGDLNVTPDKLMKAIVKLKW